MSERVKNLHEAKLMHLLTQAPHSVRERFLMSYNSTGWGPDLYRLKQQLKHMPESEAILLATFTNSFMQQTIFEIPELAYNKLSATEKNLFNLFNLLAESADPAT